jgi:hypothetical protein
VKDECSNLSVGVILSLFSKISYYENQKLREREREKERIGLDLSGKQKKKKGKNGRKLLKVTFKL